eukprot:gnl/Chilomastix_cuspidata/5285.p1 GENE.gnl/Chilomastix_cuspidata/5285~~gnl/Chilomastix_cuspidata/5285.p1  ORF type:complete len:597 (+),score=150.65 gnl/Chilomastix_cuspidata/5285:116-1792(+)
MLRTGKELFEQATDAPEDLIEEESVSSETPIAPKNPPPSMCVSHGQTFTSYCNDCKRVICPSCIEQCCHLHKTSTLREATEGPLAAFWALAEPSLADIKAFCSAQGARVLMLLRRRRMDVESHEQRVRVAAGRCAAIDADRENDRNLALAAKAAIEQFRVEAATRALSQTFEGFAHVLDDTSAVDAELDARRADFERLQVELATARAAENRQRQLHREHLWGKGLSQPPPSPLGRAVASLLFRRFLLFSPPFPATAPRSIDEFYAFRGADALPFVRASLEQPVTDRFGIRISEPVPVPAVCAPDGAADIVATLNSGGTLLWFDGAAGVLHAHNLLSGDGFSVAGWGDNVAFVAACGPYVVVGVEKERCAHRARLEDLFDAPGMDTFERFDAPTVSYFAARVDLCPFSGRVLYASEETDLVELNVLSMEARAVATVEGAQWLCGFSGLDVPSYACAGDECVDGEYRLFAYTASDFAKVSVCALPEGAAVLVPSSSDPGNLANAAIFTYDRSLVRATRHITLMTGVRPVQAQSLVRVVRDVFLTLDELTSRWVALRIAAQ